MTRLFFLLLIGFVVTSHTQQNLNELFAQYEKERILLNIPQYGLSYKDNFNGIVSADSLSRFHAFYQQYDMRLKKFNRNKLSVTERINFDHLQYILRLEQERFLLELNFKKQNGKIPGDGLAGLTDHEKWYKYYVQLYTSIRIEPDELFRFGEKEVKRSQLKIDSLEKVMGYEKKDEDFYVYLKNKKFYFSDQQTIENVYREKEAIIRKNLYKLFEDTLVSALGIATWQNATPMMPPAIYRVGENRFDYNFSEHKQNRRAMDWVFNHEGIPGHHYQFSLLAKKHVPKPAFTENVSYPGNFEGWGCYTEYLGKELGQYQTPEEELGKWEWDLVRSLRVMLDVGIHYYGWSKEKAMACWKQNIKGQDEIADREITRVSKWPAQALSYKVGAWEIEELKSKLNIDKTSIKRFHTAFLSFSGEPLEVIEKNIKDVYLTSTHSSNKP